MRRGIRRHQSTLYLLISGPCVGLLSWIVLEEAGMKPSMAKTIGVCSFMVSWWLNGIVRMGVTGLLPIVLLPLLGIASTNQVSERYFSNGIIICWGSLVMASAIETYGLHNRIACSMISFLVRAGDGAIIFGFVMVTGFLSMWLSNTATAAMMVPLARAVIQQLGAVRLKDHHGVGREEERLLRLSYLAQALDLAIAYSASVGGTATLTGTGSNIVLQGVLVSILGAEGEVSFLMWMEIAAVVALINLFVLWAILSLCFLVDWQRILPRHCLPKVSLLRHHISRYNSRFRNNYDNNSHTSNNSNSNEAEDGATTHEPDLEAEHRSFWWYRLRNQFLQYRHYQRNHIEGSSYSPPKDDEEEVDGIEVATRRCVISPSGLDDAYCNIRHYRNHLSRFSAPTAEEEFNPLMEPLGPMTYPEYVVIIVFTLMALLWVTRNPPGHWGWARFFQHPEFITDGTVAMGCCLLLFIIPSKPPTSFAAATTCGRKNPKNNLGIANSSSSSRRTNAGNRDRGQFIHSIRTINTGTSTLSSYDNGNSNDKDKDSNHEEFHCRNPNEELPTGLSTGTAGNTSTRSTISDVQSRTYTHASSSLATTTGTDTTRHAPTPAGETLMMEPARVDDLQGLVDNPLLHNRGCAQQQPQQWSSSSSSSSSSNSNSSSCNDKDDTNDAYDIELNVLASEDPNSNIVYDDNDVSVDQYHQQQKMNANNFRPYGSSHCGGTTTRTHHQYPTTTRATKPEFSRQNSQNSYSRNSNNNSKNNKNSNSHNRILHWSAIQSLNWDIIFLLGGGFALSVGIEESGLSGWMASAIRRHGPSSTHQLMIACSIFACVITNLVSNVAAANILIPALACVGPQKPNPVAPLYILAPVVMSLSMAFLSPFGTPPNAIVLGNGNISVRLMMKVGLLCSIVCSAVLLPYCLFVVPHFYAMHQVPSSVIDACRSDTGS